MTRITLAIHFCALAVCVLALLSGCGRGAPPAVNEEHSHAPVKVVAPQILALAQRTELLGSTMPLPNQAARIATQVEGRVVSILDDGKSKPLVEGQWVNEGQIVAQLDDRIAKASLEKAQALADELDELKTQSDLA